MNAAEQILHEGIVTIEVELELYYRKDKEINLRPDQHLFYQN